MCWIIEYVFGPAYGGAACAYGGIGIRTGLKIRHPLGFAGSIPARRTDHRLHFWRMLWLLELCTFLCCTFSRRGGFLLLLIGGCGVADCDECSIRDHWCCDPWENPQDHEQDTE